MELQLLPQPGVEPLSRDELLKLHRPAIVHLDGDGQMNFNTAPFQGEVYLVNFKFDRRERRGEEIVIHYIGYYSPRTS